ncbi:LPXTG cell wall anchor domain-containing protein [Streptomyces sp. NPDC090022]|uniref:LPXTG cell wall anchor domain-containing protein n=1 Tax=Streptomyces sp. NPDC090022 TaxID=3365920 RepID=UPI003820B36F
MSVRTAAATAVVAGVVTTLLPFSATAASADEATSPLRTEMSTPAPAGALTRGGTAQTFELTVKNPSGKAVEYRPWLTGEAAGPSPLGKGAVVFKVDALNAPATKSFVGQQDGGWQGTFHPAGSAQDAFSVPAGGKLTWKVTLGLGANYPTNDGDFTLTANNLSDGGVPGSVPRHVFKVSPQIKTGELKTWFEKGSEAPGPNRQLLNLNYKATGDGSFDTGLATVLTLGSEPWVAKPDFFVQAMIDGRWQDVKRLDSHRFQLPVVPKGFGSASGTRTLELRIDVGLNTQYKKATSITAEAETGLAAGNRTPFIRSATEFTLTPPQDRGPATPTAKPSPSATATTATKGTTVNQAVATTTQATTGATTGATGTTTGTTTGSATGTLASTGSSSSTGLYAGLAAALVALGTAAAWLGTRRRRNVSA